MVDAGQYFTINKARQYGKTTVLRALAQFLKDEYVVISLDFQMMSFGDFENETTFCKAYAREIIKETGMNFSIIPEIFEKLQNLMDGVCKGIGLSELFEILGMWCADSEKPIIMLIDEADSATNNQVFSDFLAQLRGSYISRDRKPTFQSVILACVYDVKNINNKLRPEDGYRMNSPWNIAADFRVDMSFSAEDIAGMLKDYEKDYRIGMNIEEMAGLIHDYTSGYPFLVSWLCKLMDETVSELEQFLSKVSVWTRQGFQEALKLILSEKNPLFESVIGKLANHPELNAMLRALLFTGKTIAYDAYNPDMDMFTMLGFIRAQNGAAVIDNRIFETRLCNKYLADEEMRKQDIYSASLQDKSQFLTDGHLNMRQILEKFVEHFYEFYGDRDDHFMEDEGWSYFLLYLCPIINGTGNYYIESRSRDMRRMDVVVDYNGEQYIIQLKRWYGQEYHDRGEQQLVGYMDDYHVKKGYMLSFNFNKSKEIGLKEIVVGDKLLVEAVV